MAKEIEEKPKKKRRQLPLAEITLLSVTVVSLLLGGFFFYKYQDVNNKYKEATLSEDDRTRRTVEEVAKLYKVPSFDEEKPVVYIVSDPEQVKNNEFFKDTQKDDVLLPYPKADLAILYRPSEKKIINVGTYSQVASSEVQVAVIAPNAAQNDLEQKLKSKYSNIVVSKKSEPKTQITKGIVVDVTGSEGDAAKTLATLLGYSVGTLPVGETAPDGVKLVVIAPNAAQ